MHPLLSFKMKEFTGIFLFWILFGITTVLLQRQQEVVELHITVKATRDSATQVYWRSKSGNYSEQDSLFWNVRQHERDMRFRIPLNRRLDFIRIDPMMHKGTATIQSVSLQRLRKPAVSLFPTLGNGTITALQQCVVSSGNNALKIVAKENDPAFEIALARPILPASPLPVLIGSVLLAGITSIFLNQNLIKGKKRSGTLLLTSSEPGLPRLPPMLPKFSTGIPFIDETTEQKRYFFQLQDIDARSLSSLIGQLKTGNPNISISFQYNRAGEV